MLKQAKKILLETEIVVSDFAIISAVVFLSVCTVWASGISSAEVITLANQSRTAAGLTILTENKDLAQAASDKAHDMIINDYFAHISPQGVEPWYWFKTAGYNYKYAGENLAINYTNAKDQDSAWMKSESHRVNILNPHYQDIGVAVVERKVDGKESLVTVELFGTPLSAVADQVTAIPPVQPMELAEVKGIATDALANMQKNSLLEQMTAVLPDRKIGWLGFGIVLFAILSVFSLMFLPAAFVRRHASR